MNQHEASLIFPVFGWISQTNAYPRYIRRHSTSFIEKLCWEFSLEGVLMGDEWGLLAPARMRMLWEQQIPNAGSVNSVSGHNLWIVFLPADMWAQERTPCPPVDFMLNKHIHKKIPWKLWWKLWIFTLKEVNHEDLMFLHPLTVFSLTMNFMKIVLSETEIYWKH